MRKEKWKIRREERGDRGKRYSFGATNPLLSFQLSCESFAAEENSPTELKPSPAASVAFGIDLRRTRADHVCLTKPSECFRSVFFFCTQGKSSMLQNNTKARNAAVHYKQLLAVGPEK